MGSMESSISLETGLQMLGVNLVAGEEIEAAVYLDDGLTEDIEQRRATLILTDRRLVRYSVATHRANAVSLALSDVDAVDVSRTEKARQRMGASLMFIAGGVLLGVVSLLFLRSPISSMLMAFSLVLIGVVFMLSYTEGLAGTLIVRAGARTIKCKIGPDSLDDMAELVERLTQLKVGVWPDGRPR